VCVLHVLLLFFRFPGKHPGQEALAVLVVISWCCADVCLSCTSCCRTEQGHKLKDQARVDATAGIVDAVFQCLLRFERLGRRPSRRADVFLSCTLCCRTAQGHKLKD
jgi:hypothetical protein